MNTTICALLIHSLYGLFFEFLNFYGRKKKFVQYIGRCPIVIIQG